MTAKRAACLLVGTTLFLGACNSHKDPWPSSQSQNQIQNVLQDLDLDPDGRTTVLSFKSKVAGTISPGNFRSNGAQIALTASKAGNTVTVEWDDRMTPTNKVRMVHESGGFEEGFQNIKTSDDSAPTFTTAGAQVAGLGDDTITVAFSGPRVVQSMAEHVNNWSLRVNGQLLDLAGTTIALDPDTQVGTITLGPNANLHAAFELRATNLLSVADTPVDAVFVGGVASGDATAPTLVSAVQNLTEDEFGMVVDFTFDDAMDPVFNGNLADYDAGGSTLATNVAQPSDTVLRVSFSEPVIPGIDTVTLSNLLDSHGNALATAAHAVAQGGPVANGFASNPTFTTVENAGGDQVVAVFTQAIDPAHGGDHTRWELDANASAVDLSLQTLTYDFLTKTLTIDLVDDYANGDSFDLRPAGGNEPIDVDGDTFTTTFAGTIGGDASLPAIASVTQNRTFDSSGQTFDVLFDEDVDGTQAQTTGNYTLSGGQNVTGAVLQPDDRTVRLTLDAVATPTVHTIDVANVEDLAGNAMTAVVAGALVSDDTTAPSPTMPVATAVEGPDNDTIAVTFDDTMVTTGITNPANWTIESPIGSARSTAAASVAFDGGSNTATITFDGPGDYDFQVLEDFNVALTGMMDIAGNAIDGTAVTGTVGGEANFPFIEAIWRDGVTTTDVHVRFSEACQSIADAYHPSSNPTGVARYLWLDGADSPLGYPTSAVASGDARQVTLTYSAAVTAGVDKLDVFGVADLAGNVVFPVLGDVIVAADATAPALSTGVSTGTALSGEDNDSITVVFDRPMSADGILNAANYSFTDGTAIDLSTADFEFDGVDTVTIDLSAAGSDPLTDGSVYTLTVDNLLSAQGVAMAGPSNDSVTPSGDAVSPALVAGAAQLDAQDTANSVLITMDEALDPTDAVVLTNYDIAAVNPDTVVQLGPRTVRATWSGGVAVAQTVNVTLTDLAGNAATSGQAIVAADASGPSLVAVSGSAAPNLGGDRILVQFDEPVGAATALDSANYAILQGAQAVDLSGAAFRYESGTNTVVIHLPAGTELVNGVDVDVTVSNVENHAQLAMAAPENLTGSTTGDGAAPSLQSAVVNWTADATGATVDLRYSEDVEAADAGDALSYTATGGNAASSASVVRTDVVRVVFAAALSPGDQVTATAIDDLAGNTAASTQVEAVQ